MELSTRGHSGGDRYRLRSVFENTLGDIDTRREKIYTKLPLRIVY